MQQFIVLITQIFFIVCIQTVIGLFIDSEKKTFMTKLLEIACYLGSLYLVFKFTYDYIIKEIMSVFNIYF